MKTTVPSRTDRPGIRDPDRATSSRLSPDSFEHPGDAHRQRVVGGVVAAGVYCIMAVLIYWPVSPLDTTRLPGPRSGDPAQMVWFVTWTPFAILHGHNPFFSAYLDAPRGVNLADNTLVPVLGLLAAPITYTLGPVASVNALFHLALAGSALAMFWALGRWTSWWPARFLGGCLYGFGGYMQYWSRSNLDLVFLVIPPLVLVCLDELFVRQRRSAAWVGLALGVLLALQLMIDAELLADMVVLIVIGLVGLFVGDRSLAIAHARLAWRGVVTASAAFVVLAAAPVWMLLAGPRRISGPLQPAWLNAGFREDLVAPVVHTMVQSTAVPSPGSGVIHWGNSSGYFGIPLVLLLLLLAWRWWRVPIVRFCAIMAIVTFVLSWGATLSVDTHLTSIPLPEQIFEHVPLLWNVLPIRLAAYQDLFASVVLGVGLERTYRWVARSVESFPAHGRHRSGAGAPGARTDRRIVHVVSGLSIAAVAILAMVPLAPVFGRKHSSGQPVTREDTATAALVTSRTPAGGTVLALPFPTGQHDWPMLWQAMSGMAFRLVSGYVFVPGPKGGTNKEIPAASLAAITRAGFRRASKQERRVGRAACRALPSVIQRTGTDSVVVWRQAGENTDGIERVVTAALGPPAVERGGTSVWTDVRNRGTRAHPGCGSL
jgi:hypothetical protein